MKQEKIYHLNLRELIDDFSSIFSTFIVATILVIVSIYLYFKNILPFIFLRAILFLYVLSFIVIVIRLYFIQIIKNLAKEIGFKLITPFYLQPRIEGTYKKNWFQIHYRSKETGKDPGVLRTYIKLQYKKKMKFDEKKLEKFRHYRFKDHYVLAVKHLTRPNKNYLLLKRDKFTFDKDKLYELMDFLLKIAKETEIKK